MIIYVFFNKVTQKVYVGQTIRSLRERVKEHVKHASKNKTHFHKALLKYGLSGFDVEILETCLSIDELNEKEIYYIDFFKACDPCFGYNEMLGGKNSQHSDLTKSKISKANYGKVKPYMTERNNLYWTEEKRKEVSAKNKGKLFCTPDKIEKMKKSKKGIVTEYIKSKRIPILCTNTGEIFSSINEASQKLNLSDGNIHGVLNGKYTHTKGFSFKRV